MAGATEGAELALDPKENAPKVGAGAAELTENEKAEAVVEVGLSDLAVEEPKLKEEPSPGCAGVVVVGAVVPEDAPNEKALGVSFIGSFSFSPPIFLSGLVS